MVDQEPGGGFRPDIEGLRAVAVLAVVLYHAAVRGLPGGFVGVDVFFVVSGFLITGLLWREIVTAGTVRLAQFYGGRARRLLPAGITVLVAVAVASAWWLPPLQARSVLGDGLASAVMRATTASRCGARTIWPRMRLPPHFSTTGRWVLRSSSTCFGQRC